MGWEQEAAIALSRLEVRIQALEAKEVWRDDVDAWRCLTLALLCLPGLRLLVSGSSFEVGAECEDFSGELRWLDSGEDPPTYGFDALIPYASFAPNWLGRVDVDFDIRGTEAYIEGAAQGLTVGGWIRFDAIADADAETLISKLWSPDDWAWWLGRLDTGDGGVAGFKISNDGSTWSDEVESDTALAADTWYFLVGRFEPGASVSVWVDGIEFTQASATADIETTVSALGWGTDHDEDFRLTGDLSLGFCCACALPDATIIALQALALDAFFP